MALNRRKLVAVQRLLVTDASRQIIAPPGVGASLRIFRINASCVTPGAQQLDLGAPGAALTSQVMSIPANATIAEMWESEEGVLQPANTSFNAWTGVAGPAWQFFIEYQIEKL
jgi:hypothetical protein